jgi:hypothetical protein
VGESGLWRGVRPTTNVLLAPSSVCITGGLSQPRWYPKAARGQALPIMQTLQDPILLLPWVCFRGLRLSKPYPRSRCFLTWYGGWMQAMGGADAFDAERQGFQSQIYLLKSEKETLERSVYSVSGELGQVKVELSMLKVRPPSPTPPPPPLPPKGECLRPQSPRRRRGADGGSERAEGGEGDESGDRQRAGTVTP